MATALVTGKARDRSLLVGLRAPSALSTAGTGTASAADRHRPDRIGPA